MFFVSFTDLDCPICGKKGSLKEHWFYDSHGDIYYIWECENCGAKSDSHKTPPSEETIIRETVLNYKSIK